MFVLVMLVFVTKTLFKKLQDTFPKAGQVAIGPGGEVVGKVCGKKTWQFVLGTFISWKFNKCNQILTKQTVPLQY